MKHPAYSQLRPVTPSVGVVLCANPSYAALEGTNTWIIRAGEDDRAIVVDPGPEDEGHLNVVRGQAREVGLTLLTHRHHDHADSAERFRQLTNAPVRAFDPGYCVDGAALQDGEVISIEGVTPQVEVVHTPGHTSDCVCFFVWSSTPHESQLEGIITGDTIAGRHTTMISETDGDLGQYLTTLRMLQERGQGVALLPGHGPDQDNVAEWAEKYLERRQYRLEQIREIRAERGDDVDLQTLIDAMYQDVDPVLRHAAEQSTRVALRYLDGRQQESPAKTGQSS
ncbi:MBL fold metallo-hydrolase [Corynebacterium propinquum]|uniref:MBL fold metallo-hydrolase n=1 Tax=Corynebacterium propinquum TaxID=43769 RepID=UPI000665F575|nr:MBL fold metallo-hydrolase [Corynebacterium propinquum]MCG7232436.1 MBL fold metallo-hydrolase [Corynebacterium propinquum]